MVQISHEYEGGVGGVHVCMCVCMYTKLTYMHVCRCSNANAATSTVPPFLMPHLDRTPLSPHLPCFCEKEVCQCDALVGMPFILLINKIDVFEQKLQSTPFNGVVPPPSPWACVPPHVRQTVVPTAFQSGSPPHLLPPPPPLSLGGA
jgi:hypothetical protein